MQFSVWLDFTAPILSRRHSVKIATGALPASEARFSAPDLTVAVFSELDYFVGSVPFR